MKAFCAFLILCALPVSAAESTVVRIGKRTEVVSAPKYGVDLGVIDQHRKVDCSFVITNRNWRERKVLGVKGNCACLETETELKTLARGEALPVKVVFNPAGMEGKVEKLVTVRMEGKAVEYPVKANVRLRLGFRPGDLNFGVVPAGTAGDGSGVVSARIAGYAATNATLELVAPVKPFFDVRLTNGVLTAAFREGTRYPGHYSEIWEVKTSDAEIPVLKVPVSARVAGGLNVVPRVIQLPREGEKLSRQVMIRAGSPRPDSLRPEGPRDMTKSGAARDRSADRTAGDFRVLAAETKPRKWGDVTIQKRPLNGWMIRIDDIDPVALRQFSKKPYLEVKTDFPGMETFEIPVSLRPGSLRPSSLRPEGPRDKTKSGAGCDKTKSGAGCEGA